MNASSTSSGGIRTLWPETAGIEGISDHQAAAVAAMLRGRVCALTGGPGTGKTHTAAAVLRRLIDRYGPSAVAVAAPTGKAAVRITAAMAKHGLPLQAKTIHRLLEVGRNGHDGGGWGFRRNAQRRLDERFFAIDEVSMLDTDLAANFFAALPDGAHVLLIGDTGQLPPVGHGAPLRDLLAAGLPCGELTEIRRNAGDIVLACDRIRRGLSFAPSHRLDPAAGHNLLHFEASTAAAALHELQTLLARLGGSSLDPVWDVQVLCATNESGALNRKTINERLRGLLNPNKCEEGCRFALGEKVICLSNQFVPTLDAWQKSPEFFRQLDTNQPAKGVGLKPSRDEPTVEFVANGETGRVVATGPGVAWVLFDCPDRLLHFAGGKAMLTLDLAYAITVHKSQGSQWPVTVYLIDDSRGARWVGCRELVYTALSRAERLMVTIGRRDLIDVDCRKVALAKRKTFLAEDAA